MHYNSDFILSKVFNTSIYTDLYQMMKQNLHRVVLILPDVDTLPMGDQEDYPLILQLVLFSSFAVVAA